MEINSNTEYEQCAMVALLQTTPGLEAAHDVSTESTAKTLNGISCQHSLKCTTAPLVASDENGAGKKQFPPPSLNVVLLIVESQAVVHRVRFTIGGMNVQHGS